MSDASRDIGRAVGRLFRDLQASQRRNNPEGDIVSFELTAENVGVSDTVTVTVNPPSPGYGGNQYGVSTYD